MYLPPKRARDVLWGFDVCTRPTILDRTKREINPPSASPISVMVHAQTKMHLFFHRGNVRRGEGGSNFLFVLVEIVDLPSFVKVFTTEELVTMFYTLPKQNLCLLSMKYPYYSTVYEIVIN